MNKYVKLKDAMEVHRQFAINGRLASNIMEKYDNLSTIEIDEDSISRKWVLNEIITKIENDDSLTKEQKDSLSAAKYLIRHAPPVVPQQKEGEWIRTGRTNIYGGIEVQCSNCGDKVMVQHLEDEWYCRHCGADMGMKGADDEGGI